MTPGATDPKYLPTLVWMTSGASWSPVAKSTQVSDLWCQLIPSTYQCKGEWPLVPIYPQYLPVHGWETSGANWSPIPTSARVSDFSCQLIPNTYQCTGVWPLVPVDLQYLPVYGWVTSRARRSLGRSSYYCWAHQHLGHSGKYNRWKIEKGYKE
jgi:hypothetical protein